MGQITVGNKSVVSASVGNDMINRIYFGHTLIYIYVGKTLLDADGKFLLDSNGNNLMCE